MELLQHIAIAISLVTLFWALRQPEVQSLIDRVCADAAKFLDKNVFSKELEDEMIRNCIKDAFNMQEQIMDAKDENEVEAWYWEIDKLDMAYRDKVPDQLLGDHTSRLYNTCMHKREILRNPTKVFDSPEISLS